MAPPHFALTGEDATPSPTTAREQPPMRRRRRRASAELEEAPTIESHSEAATSSGWSTSAPNTPPRSRNPSRWVDPGACEALCQLILDDRHMCSPADGSSPPKRRKALPPFLYAEAVAPFLRFDKLLPNMLYAFGGRNQEQGPLDTVEMFDTWHGVWVSCSPMPTRRAGSAAAVLDDGRMMVVGGYDEQGIAEGLLASCDVYDPATRKWADDIASLTRARWGHGCATLRGKVYVVGGCSLQPEAQAREAFMETLKSCEVYCPVENRWTASAPLQISRSGSRVVAIGDSRLAAIGGCDDVFGRAETQPTVEIFDLESKQWSLLPQKLLNPRTTAGAVAVDDRQLFVFGGAPSLSSAEVYDLKTAKDGDDVGSEEDRKLAELLEGRMGCQAAVLNLPAPGKSYPLANRRCAVVIGGERCDELDDHDNGSFTRIRQFASVPVFDIETRCWLKEEIVPPMPAARTAVAVCVGLGHAVDEAARRRRRISSGDGSANFQEVARTLLPQLA
eukprot:TRINITY_DN6307_c0_g1_i1.p1 TRINITY_DN6307_c0_g1~~TRINITY_DN6307_c0_g1_i1.p1  ORF type:complete len:504 (+),score=111.66 TRINITY_DN6307_c0_g1_i1:69-1580(+)